MQVITALIVVFVVVASAFAGTTQAQVGQERNYGNTGKHWMRKAIGKPAPEKHYYTAPKVPKKKGKKN